MVDASSSSPLVRLSRAESNGDFDALRLLFVEYQKAIDVDLCFQNFQEELADLPGMYSSGEGGVALVASVDSVAAGCCAVRQLTDGGYDEACEMKRLFVRPAFRGFGLGAMLVERAMTEARILGYRRVLLDTLDDMVTARALYQAAGFVEVAPYYHNPLPGTHYLAAEL
jgi:putative acetyltransferase